MFDIKVFLIEQVTKRVQSYLALQDTAKIVEKNKEESHQEDQTFNNELLAPILKDLTDIYVELRHYTGKWPVVYTDAQISKYPFFQGTTDDTCNPYYRMSMVQSKQSDGLTPIFSPPDRTGGPDVVRDRNYTLYHVAAGNALALYPNHTGEDINVTPWDPAQTAPELLRAALNAWKNDLQLLSDSDATYNKDEPVVSQPEDPDPRLGSTMLTIIDLQNAIVTTLSNIPPSPVSPIQTPMASGALATNISFLLNATNIYITTALFGDRINFLQNRANSLEQQAFEIIKIRLHATSGTLATTKGHETTLTAVQSTAKNEDSAISTINNMLGKL